MRSGTRLAASLAALVAACGNYSTEDLRFLAALPQRHELRVAVPAQGGPAGGLVGPCGTRAADVWLWAKPTGDGWNAGVSFVIGLVDVVRRVPPTWRGDDVRGWGPFDDAGHAGRELRIVIARSYPAGPDGLPSHAYVFEARVKGAAAFTPVLSGTFDGASSSRGRGTMVLDFDAMWSVGVNDAGTPHGVMQIAYDRASDPVTIDLSLARDGFGIVQFDYGFVGYAAGSGAFDYAFRDAAGNRFVVGTGFDATGAGRGAVAVTTARGASGGFRQCWDAAACLVFVDDPGNYSCAAPPCSLGAVGACPAVPVSPF